MVWNILSCGKLRKIYKHHTWPSLRNTLIWSLSYSALARGFFESFSGWLEYNSWIRFAWLTDYCWAELFQEKTTECLHLKGESHSNFSNLMMWRAPFNKETNLSLASPTKLLHPTPSSSCFLNTDLQNSLPNSSPPSFPLLNLSLSPNVPLS